MKRIAIVPTEYLEFTKNQKMHMVLAQKCKDPTYMLFFKRMKEEGKYLILDNGAAEGKMMSAEDIIKIAKELKADEVVLPDAFNDYNGTCREYHNNIDLFRKELPGVKIMAVLPSTNELEIRTFACMVKENVDVIGIPKVIANGNPYMRGMVAALIDEYEEIEIHFLGAIDIADKEETRDCVRSIDSALPYIQARNLLSTFEYRNPANVIDCVEGDYKDDYMFYALLKSNLELWWRR